MSVSFTVFCFKYHFVTSSRLTRKKNDFLVYVNRQEMIVYDFVNSSFGYSRGHSRVVTTGGSMKKCNVRGQLIVYWGPLMNV